MRVAAIDCGTNSIRLLIADATVGESGVNLHDVERVMRIIRLGEGVDSTGRISDAALERAFAAARDYADLIQKHGAERLRFAATSASRDAENRDVFINGIREILGVTPEVIPGTEEAELSFAGSVSGLGAREGKTLVVDLGGGSTEFVVGDADGVIGAKSVNIGCVRLTERHSISHPLQPEEAQAILADVDAAIDDAFSAVDVSSATALVGVAGTVTTVTAQALSLDSYDAAKINGTELSLEEIQKAAAEISGMTREERAALGFMHEGRIDVIGAGALIWSRIVERVNQETSGVIKTAVTSEYDILDGIALSLVPQS